MLNKRLLAQIIVYLVGLTILAFGVVFAINSALGISPVNAVPFASSIVSGVGMGISVTVFFLICIGLQIILLGKEFKWINLTQIIFSFIFGFLVDFGIWVIGDFTFAALMGDNVMLSYIGQLIMKAISLVLIAIGLAVYLDAKLINLPSEGLCLAIVDKTGKTFPKVKVAFDCVLVIIAISITLIFLGRLEGIREGTVIAAIFIGKLIPMVRKFTVPALDKFGFYALRDIEVKKED